MLNPDGVIFGNNRCGLAGVDLNRQWKTPAKALHPTVFALKTMIQEQKTVRDISMYIDLHGHSRKYNIFMYGCEEKKRPNPKVRAFPKFFSLHSVGKKYVSYADCSFHVRKGREATARVVVARDIGIPLSYTVEATFCGADSGPLKYCHMNTGHLEEVGFALVDSFIQHSIAEGDVSDAVIINSRKSGNSANSSHVTSSGQSKKKDNLKTVALAQMLPADESSNGCSGRLDYVSDSGGDDVLSDDEGSCIQSVVTGMGSEAINTRNTNGFAERRVGQYSARGVKTASTVSSNRTTDGGIALLSSVSRTRSDTAPVAGVQYTKEKSADSRLLARDDGFSFSESVAANRMIAGVVSGNKPASAKPVYSTELSDRYEFVYCT